MTKFNPGDILKFNAAGRTEWPSFQRAQWRFKVLGHDMQVIDRHGNPCVILERFDIYTHPPVRWSEVWFETTEGEHSV